MEFVLSELGDDPIVVESYFPVSPERVFQAWTEPAIVMKWFGLAPNSLHSASIDLRIGGAWEFVKSNDATKLVKFEGTYLDIVPGERLSFSWSLVTEFKNGTRDTSDLSQVDIVFSQKGTGTNVRLVHSSIDSDTFSRGFAKGWETAFSSLQNVLNG